MTARLGPSGTPADDHFGMARLRARVEPWPHMPEHHRTSSATRPSRALRRDIIRILAVILSIIALLLTSSALNWVTEAAAPDQSGLADMADSTK